MTQPKLISRICKKVRLRARAGVTFVMEVRLPRTVGISADEEVLLKNLSHLLSAATKKTIVGEVRFLVSEGRRIAHDKISLVFSLVTTHSNIVADVMRWTNTDETSKLTNRAVKKMGGQIIDERHDENFDALTWCVNTVRQSLKLSIYDLSG